METRILTVQAGSFQNPIDAVLRPVHRDPHQPQVRTAEEAHRRAIVVIIARFEHLFNENCTSDTPIDRPPARRGKRLRICFENHDGLAEHRQIAVVVGIGVIRAEKLRLGPGDPADEEGGRVESLPGRQVVT